MIKYLFLSPIFFLAAFSAYTSPLGQNETAEVEARLEAFSRGTVSLYDMNEQAWCEKLYAYYYAHSNRLSTVQLLPVARAFAIGGQEQLGARLARTYLNVYTNDSRAWDVLGACKMGDASYPEALEALTNALRLGSDRNIVGLGLASLMLERHDVLKELVIPRLLKLKDSSAKPLEKRMEMVTVLVGAAIQIGDEDLLLKSIAGITPVDAAQKSDLSCLLDKARAKFKSEKSQAALKPFALTTPLRPTEQGELSTPTNATAMPNK